MGNAYRPEAWHELYVALCGASAALAGLLFIATSLRVEGIIKDYILRARSGYNTFLIVYLIIETALVLIPQSVIALSVELAVCAFALVPIYARGMFVVKKAGGQIPLRAYVIPVASIIGFGGALSLAFGSGGGMYIVTFFMLAQLAWVMWNAWGLMLATTAAS